MVAKRVRRDERPKLINVKEKDGRVLTEKNAVCVTGIQYFEALFNVREKKSVMFTARPRMRIRSFEKAHPGITKYEVDNFLNTLIASIAPGLDRITTEHLMQESSPDKMLAKVYIVC